MKKLVVIGNISIDSVYLGNRLVSVQAGGAGLNVAIGSVKSGVIPTLVSVIGTDLPAVWYQLISGAIEDKIRTVDGLTCRFDLRYDAFEHSPNVRCIFGVSTELTRYACSAIDDTSWLHVCCRAPLDAGAVVQSWGNRTNASISVDFIHSSIAAQFRTVQPYLPSIAIMFMNSRELQYLRSVYDVAAIPGSVVVTDGARGVDIVREGRTIHHEPAVTLEHVVDTSGAGDVFAGAYVAGTVSGLPIDECSKQAARVAAWSVQGVGTLHLLQQTAGFV